MYDINNLLNSGNPPSHNKSNLQDMISKVNGSSSVCWTAAVDSS